MYFNISLLTDPLPFIYFSLYASSSLGFLLLPAPCPYKHSLNT